MNKFYSYYFGAVMVMDLLLINILVFSGIWRLWR